MYATKLKNLLLDTKLYTILVFLITPVLPYYAQISFSVYLNFKEGSPLYVLVINKPLAGLVLAKVDGLYFTAYACMLNN